MSEGLVPPDWLPDGWIMEVRKGKKGFTYRYYTCPISNRTFCSREDVIDYLTAVKTKSCASKTTKSFEDKDQQITHKLKDSLKWLPPGWIMDIRARKASDEMKVKYKSTDQLFHSHASQEGNMGIQSEKELALKTGVLPMDNDYTPLCYINRSTGSIYYSKEDVLQSLEVEHAHDCVVSAPKRNFRIGPNEFVLLRFEYSPDNFPHGWIKAAKFRLNGTSHTKMDLFEVNNHMGVRCTNAGTSIHQSYGFLHSHYPYFIDPECRYVFRTFKDCMMFIDSGTLSKYVTTPMKLSALNILGSEQYPVDSPSPKKKSKEDANQ